MITVTYGNDAQQQIINGDADADDLQRRGSVEWDCANGAGLENKWLPAACRP